MAVNGPPAEEHLLARVSRWFNYYAGGFLQRLNGGTARPVAESPEVNRIISDSPLLPDYEDLVGPDEEVGLWVPERDEEDLWPQEIIPPPLDYEEEEEEIDVVGLAEDEPQVAVPQGAVQDVAGDGRRGQENARAPSPPPQQLPPPNFGMDWGPPAPAAAYLPADPFAFPFAPPYAPHFAFPYVPPNAAPYIPPFAPPYAPHFAFPYVPPYAAPYIPPFAPPYAPHFAFPYVPPYALPHVPPFAFPYAPPYAPPFAFPYAAPYAPPFAFPHAPLHPFPFAGPPAPPPADADEDEDEGIAVAGVDGEQQIVIPQLDAETIGPLSAEQSLGFFTSEEDEESPSTSGLSSSTKRSREETDEQAATKRPRWSDDSDSDSD